MSGGRWGVSEASCCAGREWSGVFRSVMGYWEGGGRPWGWNIVVAMQGKAVCGIRCIRGGEQDRILEWRRGWRSYLTSAVKKL